MDIGFACLSGMFERNDDVLYICYDNEAYMNTGVQRSGATPPAARTSTTQTVGDEPGNVFGQGKNVPLIAMAHEIPYVATATVADLRDLEYKVERAMEMRGARYLHLFVTCPLGWGSASRDSIRVARLAKESGLFPVFEAEHGEVVGVSQDPAPRARRGVPEAPAPFRAPVRGPPAPRRDRSDSGHRRSQHRALRPARRGNRRTPSCRPPNPPACACPRTRRLAPRRLVTDDTGASRLAEETTQGASRPGRLRCASPRTPSSGPRTPRAPTTSPYRALDEKTRRER